MSFVHLGMVSFLLGLAAVAGLLYLLQRLRVKFREKEVVTTLFWKQAMEETHARVLMKRFRHPLAYLLAFLIAGLVWLAFAGPAWHRDDEAEVIFLLDGSAGMAWGDRFERAKAILKQEADRMPAAQRSVYFCGADPRLILARGEETCLLMPRLANLAPEACPASIEQALFAFLAGETAARERKILVVGDAPVSRAWLDMLPDNADIARLRSDETPQLENNVGIASIGVAEAASGAFDRVDVMFSMAGTGHAGITLTLDGRALNQAPAREAGAYYLRDLPARGEVLEIALASEDPLALDNSARITLPTRPTVAVSVDANLDERFHALIDADPALVPATPDSEAARVLVGGSTRSTLPSVELVTGNGIAVVHEAGLHPLDLERLQTRFFATGLDRVGKKLMAGPAQDHGFRLSPRYVPGPQRKVQIGIDLLGDDYDFTSSSAFPLFMTAAIHWLAGVEAMAPFAAAGEPSVLAGRLSLAGSDYAPPRAGRYLDRKGEAFEVSLGAAPASDSPVLKQVTRWPGSGAWPRMVSWCILLALCLMGIEWWLFQKGRMP